MPTTLTNQNPLLLTGTGGMASDFWATISVPVGQGKPLKVTKVVWQNPGASANFVITDASTGALVLLQGNTPASFVGQDVEYDFVSGRAWRNFKCTTLTAGSLLIYYI